MPLSSLNTRLKRLERIAPRLCPACRRAVEANGKAPYVMRHMFRYEGKLLNIDGVEVPESEIALCTTCGGGEAGLKIIVGIHPDSLG